MALPVDYDTVPVRGKYVYLDGTPAAGNVKFTGKQLAVSGSTDTIVVPNAITATLDANGQFTVNLPATNDPDILPNGWTYTVTENLVAGGGRTFDIDVPIEAKTTGIDLSEVAPVTPSSGDPTAFVTLTAFEAHVAAGGDGGGSVDWANITSKPATFPPDLHTHPISGVDGLQAALDAKRDIIVLGPSDPVPPGTRVNSIILRTA